MNERALPNGVYWEPCKCGLVRLIVDSISVNGGQIGWGCPRCNLQRAEAAERRLKFVPDEELRILLTGAEEAHPDAKLCRLLRELAERRAADRTAANGASEGRS